MSSVELHFAVFAFLEAEVRLFPLCKSCKIFWHFPQLLKGSKTTELKQPHPQGFLFVVPIFRRFTVEVILPDIANVIGESGICASQNRWNIWNGYWVMLCSEVVALCLITSVDREFLGWGWVTNLRSYSYGRLASCKEVQGSPSLCHWNLDSLFKSLLGFRIPWAVCWIPEPEVSAFH